jgi:hypothetical protein
VSRARVRASWLLGGRASAQGPAITPTLRDGIPKPRTAAPQTPLVITGRLAQPTWRLSSRAVYVLALGATLGAGFYLYSTEGGRAGLFVSAVMLTIAALLVFVIRRLLPAVVLVSSMIAIIRVSAYVKQQTSEVLLHAHDVVSLLSSWSALSQFWHDQRQHVLSLAAVLAATAVAVCVAYRIDSTRIGRRFAAPAAILLVCLTYIAAAAKGERRHTEYYFENVYVSFFLASWRETLEALWRGGLMEAAPASPALPLDASAPCEPRSRPPHIILIHQESVVPPSHFPSLSYDRSLDAFFQSHDGQLRKLRVETFGGGSWLTEFSVLTGLSIHSFGGMRQFVQQIMAGKVKEALPQALTRCGYRNVVFYPMLRHFLASGRFFEGAGLRRFSMPRPRARSCPTSGTGSTTPTC